MYVDLSSIWVHQMHGQVHPSASQSAILFIYDPLSSLASYPVITYPYPSGSHQFSYENLGCQTMANQCVRTYVCTYVYMYVYVHDNMFVVA